MNDRTDDDLLRAQDEERRFFRCVELANLAEDKGITGEDLQDLRYELGVSDYFRRQA